MHLRNLLLQSTFELPRDQQKDDLYISLLLQVYIRGRLGEGEGVWEGEGEGERERGEGQGETWLVGIIFNYKKILDTL